MDKFQEKLDKTSDSMLYRLYEKKARTIRISNFCDLCKKFTGSDLSGTKVIFIENRALSLDDWVCNKCGEKIVTYIKDQINKKK